MDSQIIFDNTILQSDFKGVVVDPEAAKWETLIDQIIEGNVIPVIGCDILMDGINLERYLIDYLAKTNGITSQPTNFSELLYDPAFKDRENIYCYLNSWCAQNSSQFKPSNLLKRLLSIRQFPFVITTSFFPVVENTMTEVWRDRKVKTMAFSNNPSTTRNKGIGDISNASDISMPTVYYMFGKACNSAHRFVVTDSDMLSFCRSWLSSDRRPPVLSSVLKDKYLLVLGNNYPDWLFRFIWYSMNLADDSKDSFSKVQGMLVNDKADDTLVRFLNRLDTFTQKDPLFVIDKIERALSSRQAEIEAHKFDKPQLDCDVFISYSWRDAELAKQLYESLTEKGLKVWYDRDKEKVGYEWLREIEQAIETCRVFIPILTQRVLSEGNDFHVYRQEWKIADRRSEGYNRSFIIPLAADNTSFHNVNFPASFRAVNGGHFNEKTPDFSHFAKDVISYINTL